jgi:hypothetical protein
VTLPKPLMEALLGAISDPSGKPNSEQIIEALQQLAEATAAVCKAIPNRGLRERFEMAFAMECEKRNSPTPDDEGD